MMSPELFFALSSLAALVFVWVLYLLYRMQATSPNAESFSLTAFIVYGILTIYFGWLGSWYHVGFILGSPMYFLATVFCLLDTKYDLFLRLVMFIHGKPKRKKSRVRLRPRLWINRCPIPVEYQGIRGSEPTAAE